MAGFLRGMSYNPLSTEQKIVKLQSHLSSTNPNLSDLLFEKFGTNRISEIRGIIGDNGQPFEQLLNNYLQGL